MTQLVQCPSAKDGKYSIPRSVMIIDDNAFSYCKSLTDITSYAITPQKVYSETFRGIGNVTLHVTKGCKSIYENTEYWSVFPVVEDAIDSLAPLKFCVNAISNDEIKGNVSGSGTYDEGFVATVTATPNEGYEFVK